MNRPARPDAARMPAGGHPYGAQAGRPDRVLWFGLLALAVLATAAYLRHHALPGNNPAAPEGWFGWFDQGNYLRSAEALRRGDFAPDKHWYPLGYSALAAPFALGWRQHPFFPVDLAALLVSYAAVLAFGRRIGLAPGWSAVAFVLPLLEPYFRDVWTEPWNTSPTTALIWLLLACIGAHLTRPRAGWRLVAIGALAMGIPALRPTDAGLAAIALATLGLHDLLARRLRPRDIALVLAGGALVALPYAALHLAIYGPHATPYMVMSRRYGFAFADLGFKAFVLLQDPTGWFGGGAGLLQRAPWIALGFAGALPAIVAAHGPARWLRALLAAMLAWHLALYLAYLDLLPTGLWTYHNIHYFKWTLPGFAMLALLLLRQFWAGPRLLPAASLAGVLLLLSLRLEPVPAGPDDPARLVLLPGPKPGWHESYFSDRALRDDSGPLPQVAAVRLMPYRDGMWAIGTRGPFTGPLRWDDTGAPFPVQHRFAERLTLRWPCFLPPYPCRRGPGERSLRAELP